MKCNVRELAHLSDQPCVIEGRLNYKKISAVGYRHQAVHPIQCFSSQRRCRGCKSELVIWCVDQSETQTGERKSHDCDKIIVFKERWFRLINNYLFYFKISEMGKFDTKNPAGVFVMENSSIQMEHGQNIPFSFSISFIDEPEKRHQFAARTEDNVVQWVIKLRQCSYEYLRSQLHTLQSKIYSITGKDPLLLVPRNEGACLWAPAVPFSTAAACSVNTTHNASSFSCHLHTNGAFTLERSKSDVQAHMHLQSHFSKKTTFYTDDIKTSEKKEDTGFGLERSKTSTQFSGSMNNFNASIFDNRPMYSRAAPSPPARSKLSPCPRPTDVPRSNEVVAENSKFFTSSSILDEAPVPPRRKISPRSLEIKREHNSQSQSSEDLIQF